MKDAPVPRVGFQLLKNFIGRKVLFVGRVESVMPDGTVTLVAPDGSRVSVQSNSPFEASVVEVEGVVVDPMTIREDSHTNFTDNFDMNLYSDLLNLANDQKYVEMFRPSNM